MEKFTAKDAREMKYYSLSYLLSLIKREASSGCSYVLIEIQRLKYSEQNELKALGFKVQAVGNQYSTRISWE